jgi:hypothetical protein
LPLWVPDPLPLDILELFPFADEAVFPFADNASGVLLFADELLLARLPLIERALLLVEFALLRLAPLLLAVSSHTAKPSIGVKASASTAVLKIIKSSPHLITHQNRNLRVIELVSVLLAYPARGAKIVRYRTLTDDRRRRV